MKYTYRVTGHVEGVFRDLVVNGILGNAAGSCSIYLELDFTALLGQSKKIRCFIDGLSHSQETMVTQDQQLAAWAQCVCQSLPFFWLEYDAVEISVDSLCLPIQDGNVLVDHVKGSGKGRPCLSVNRMSVTGCIDMRISPMKMAVDLEASCIRWSLQISTNRFAIMVKENQI